jgi:hypothetical protein
VGELAFVGVGAKSFFHEVFAEGALCFGRSALKGEGEMRMV